MLTELRQHRSDEPVVFDRSDPRTMSIYFIQPVGGGPVKIGSAKSVRERFWNIQTCSPVILRVLATIPDKNFRYERELHDRFAASRLHGEWFHPTPELLDFVEGLDGET